MTKEHKSAHSLRITRVHLLMLKSFHISELNNTRIHFVASAERFQREPAHTRINYCMLQMK